MIYQLGERQVRAEGEYFIAESAMVIGAVLLQGRTRASGSTRSSAATTS